MAISSAPTRQAWLLIRFMQAAAWLLLGLMLASAGLILFAPDLPTNQILQSHYGIRLPTGDGLSPWQLVLLTHAHGWVLMSLGLWRLTRMFGHFAAGRVFRAEPLADLRVATLAFVGSVLIDLAITAVLQRAYGVDPTHAASAGQVVGVHLYMLFFCGVFAVVAWVLERALDVARENEGFV